MTELPALTKLDVAQREINAAVNMTFAGGDPVAICVLASAARAIVGALCEIADASSFKKELQDFEPEMSDRAYYKAANKAWNFFKHADQDPEDVLEGFKPDDADSILFTAVFDFGALCQGKSIEAQVFEGWFLFRYGNPEDVPAGLPDFFPDLPNLNRHEAISLGREVLEWAKRQPDFRMTYSLEFRRTAKSLQHKR